MEDQEMGKMSVYSISFVHYILWCLIPDSLHISENSNETITQNVNY